MQQERKHKESIILWLFHYNERRDVLQVELK